jgi:hypothetical protein
LPTPLNSSDAILVLRPVRAGLVLRMRGLRELDAYRLASLLLVKEKVAAKRPDEVCWCIKMALQPSRYSKPHPSFAALTDTLSLTGRGAKTGDRVQSIRWAQNREMMRASPAGRLPVPIAD